MDFSKRLNDITNVGILVLIVFLGVQFARIYGKGQVSFYKTGDIVRGIPQDALRESPRTLLIQVNSDCPACESALPFYRNVRQVRDERLPLRILAVTVEEPSVCREYLRENSISVDGVLSPEPGEKRLRMTPALVLVDSNAVVVGADVTAALHTASGIGERAWARVRRQRSRRRRTRSMRWGMPGFVVTMSPSSLADRDDLTVAELVSSIHAGLPEGHIQLSAHFVA